MKITVNILPDNTATEVVASSNSTILELLKKMKLRPDAIIVLREKIPIPIDEVVGKTKELQIVKVASGG